MVLCFVLFAKSKVSYHSRLVTSCRSGGGSVVSNLLEGLTSIRGHIRGALVAAKTSKRDLAVAPRRDAYFFYRLRVVRRCINNLQRFELPGELHTADREANGRSALGYERSRKG